jgi:peptide chain release factor 1
VRTWREWQQLGDDIEAARELAAEDPSSPPRPTTAADAARSGRGAAAPAAGAARPDDDKDAILEVKSGEGGEESALFAGDLLRMYTRYAERAAGRPRSSTPPSPTSGGYKSSPSR